ncbi:AAA family ATPase [Pseudomonas viridiflava]|uniref:AAA family ATPase n=1 Tax=Pseudomonas viridiflava TaxID=33069 RepID=UPI000F06CAD4|nr:ATP-binding protein [Pseudomonas viridiflava]
MTVRIDKIIVSDFKRIESLEIDLQPVTALVGGNTSGKSSALQAAQLGVSILQAAFRGFRPNGSPDFAGTVANDAVLFRPTELLLDLRRGGSATQNLGYSVTYCGFDPATEANKQIKIIIRRGKNANIAITREGDDDFAAVLANSDRPFSIFTPGLSGIPIREEWRTKGAMDAAVMHGDANLYLRTVLDHLYTRDMDGMAKAAWSRNRDIDFLPDSGWKTFSQLLDRCYPGTRVVVSHDDQRDRYVNVEVETTDAQITLDMASTGMLQVIQIIAYACFYSPPLILLDEPDAHLHADSQARLYEALRSVADTGTRILFASHSPQLIQRLMYDPKAALVWMRAGEKVPVDDAQRPAIPILMTLGALSAGADAFDPARPVILMTEDKLSIPVTALAKANGAPDNLAVLSYNGCGNLRSARLLARMITDMRPDVRIVLHRDRDFRTEQEMRYELSSAIAEHLRKGATRVTDIFTPLNDVEHSFANADHLKQVFNEIPPELIDAAITDVITLKRDDLTNAARVARDQIVSSLYDVPRKRAKPEWAASEMPNNSPAIQLFLPANGAVPVPFQHAHGKMLMYSLRPKIHQLVGGPTQVSNSRIFTVTDHLRAQNWQDAFAAD